jgi:hypothetical protein
VRAHSLKTQAHTCRTPTATITTTATTATISPTHTPSLSCSYHGIDTSNVLLLASSQRMADYVKAQNVTSFYDPGMGQFSSAAAGMYALVCRWAGRHADVCRFLSSTIYSIYILLHMNSSSKQLYMLFHIAPSNCPPISPPPRPRAILQQPVWRAGCLSQPNTAVVACSCGQVYSISKCAGIQVDW